MSKWQQSEICIVINNKSQGIKAKHLRFDELLYHPICWQKNFFFIIGVHIWQSYRQNGDCFVRPPCTFVLKDAHLSS